MLIQSVTCSNIKSLRGERFYFIVSNWESIYSLEIYNWNLLPKCGEREREKWQSINSCYYFAIKVHCRNSESHHRPLFFFIYTVFFMCSSSSNRQPWNWYSHTYFPIYFTRWFSFCIIRGFYFATVYYCATVSLRSSQSVPFIIPESHTVRFFFPVNIHSQWITNSGWSFFFHLCKAFLPVKVILMKSSWVTVYLCR